MQITYEFSWVDILLLLLLAGFLLLVFGRKFIKRLFRSTQHDSVDRDEVKRKWQEIETLMSERKSETSYKLAIIEADKLLDFSLKSMIIPGQNLGERLKVAAYKYPNIKRVWWAHKVRNQLVHDTRYHIKYNVARKVISLYKETLKDLGVL